MSPNQGALHDELSALMDVHNQYMGGDWELRVRATSDGRPIAYHQISMSPAELARYHLDAYKAAAQAADPTITGWRRVVPEDDCDYAFMLFADRRPQRR